MTTLMRIGRDRRSGKPVMCHARKERVLLFGTRSADYIRASGQSGRIQRPNTWLHPNSSLKGQIFPLHRGRRPYMAHSGHSRHRNILSVIGVTADIARTCRRLLAVVPDIGREPPVSSDLLPHHDILAGDFLRGRTLGFQAKGPDFAGREPPEPLDVDG